MWAYAIVLDERMEWLHLFAKEWEAREALGKFLLKEFGVKSSLRKNDSLFNESFTLKDSHGDYVLKAYIHTVED